MEPTASDQGVLDPSFESESSPPPPDIPGLHYIRAFLNDPGAAARLLTDLVRAEVELENLLGVTRVDAEHSVPLRLSLLAAEAHRRDLLSEG